MRNPAQGEPGMLACTYNRLKAKKSLVIGNIYDTPHLLKIPNA